MNIAKKIYSKLPEKVKAKLRKKLKKQTDYNKETLIKELLKYDVISFDIFDTLITRIIYNPDDIFNMIEHELIGIELKDSLYTMRKKSEEHANSIKQHDVNIDEIYFSMMDLYGYTEDEINGIKGIEVELEKKITYPRKDMLDVLEILVKNNKKVILTSDMYLNKYIVEELLKKCGYLEGKHYHKIYLSNDKNFRKDSGTMWKHLNILYSGLKFIHIGDNVNSDYIIPMSFGMKAICLPNARDQLRKSNFYNFIKKYDENRTIDESLFLGYILNTQIFNSPFSKNITSLEVFSKVQIAPILFELLNHIDANTKNNDKLLFLAREGYNLQKLYKDYCEIFNKKEKDNYYFLASRKATMSSLIDNDDDILNSLNKDYSGSIKTLLKSLYDIDYKGPDRSIKLPDDISIIKDKVLEYNSLIIEKSNNYKKAYINYIDEILDNRNNMVIIDLGYSGTIQFNLSRMLNKNLKGLYLTNSETVKRFSKDSELNFAYDINNNKDYLRIYNYSLILEYFLSAPYGQLQYFELENGKSKPVYNDEIMDDNKKKNNKIIYDSVIDYFNFVKSIEGLTNSTFKELAFISYRGIVESNIIDKSVKDEFDFMDSYNDSIKKNVFKIISKY